MSENATPDVFGWLADRTGCGTIRIMQPFDALAYGTGVNAVYSERLKLEGFMPKVLVGQRVCKDPASAVWQHIAGNEVRPKLVYELDDDLFNVDASNVMAHEWFINGHDLRANEWHDVQANIEANIRVADRVTVTTEALAKLVRPWNADVRVVPNTLPKWVVERERAQNERVTIGWMGSATHTMDWEQASPQIRRFLNRNPEVLFKMIGASYGDWLKLPEDQVDFVEWIPSVEDAWKAIDFDIALAPLRPHLFNQSKSNLKALEAAALGIPVIASDCGPYPEFVEHGKTGFLVKQDYEWGKYLRELVNDEAMRAEMGANAKAKAREWTLEGNLDMWKAALLEW